MTSKGLLKAHVTLELVARSKYHVFLGSDNRWAVAYHIAGSLWNVVGDAPTQSLAEGLCAEMNRKDHGTDNPQL